MSTLFYNEFDDLFLNIKSNSELTNVYLVYDKLDNIAKQKNLFLNTIQQNNKLLHNFSSKLKHILINDCNKKYVTKRLFDDSIKHYYSRVEQKLSEAKTDIFKWFIKTNIAQTSILIALIFTLLDFFFKK